MSDRDIMALLNRADAADRRMQYLQDAIDRRTHWLDAAKERIKVLEKRVAELESTLAPRHP